jgi:hypothetical protein
MAYYSILKMKVTYASEMLTDFQTDYLPLYHKQTKQLRGLSPPAKYTDRATATYGRSANFLADRGCCVVSATDPHGRILGFLDRNRYYLLLQN